eukprot:snap_masked-scaffold_2-processed-gene-4.34-mRNA-1 protein AED:1.00 eAED:1.00 QI:0/-1/0/0/-1/1/1/0/81
MIRVFEKKLSTSGPKHKAVASLKKKVIKILISLLKKIYPIFLGVEIFADILLQAGMFVKRNKMYLIKKTMLKPLKCLRNKH